MYELPLRTVSSKFGIIAGYLYDPVVMAHLFRTLQALLTDMYQVTMSYAYWKAGRHNEQVRTTS